MRESLQSKHWTCVVAEDEALLRQALVAELQRAWPGLQVLAECEDGASAVEALAEHQPHVAFLDIRMPGLTGLEVARVAEQAIRGIPEEESGGDPHEESLTTSTCPARCRPASAGGTSTRTRMNGWSTATPTYRTCTTATSTDGAARGRAPRPGRPASAPAHRPGRTVTPRRP